MPDQPLKDLIYEPLIYSGLGAILMAIFFMIGLAVTNTETCDSKANNKCVKAHHKVRMGRARLHNEAVELERLFTTETLKHQESVLDLCLALKETQAKLKKAHTYEQSELLKNELFVSLIDTSTPPPKKPDSKQTTDVSAPDQSQRHKAEFDWPVVCQEAQQRLLDKELVEDREIVLNICSDIGASGDCATTPNDSRRQRDAAKESSK